MATLSVATPLPAVGARIRAHKKQSLALLIHNFLLYCRMILRFLRETLILIKIYFLYHSMFVIQ